MGKSIWKKNVNKVLDKYANLYVCIYIYAYTLTYIYIHTLNVGSTGQEVQLLGLGFSKSCGVAMLLPPAHAYRGLGFMV